MLIKNLSDCKEFIAGDNTILRELLNPLNQKKDNLKLRYSLAHAIVKPNQTTQLHKLKTSEVYYILQGKGIMFIENEPAEVKAGDMIYIPPNSAQKIKNIEKEDLVFICIVDPAWKKEDETVLK